MKKPKSFEEGITRLEALLEQISSEETPLAEAVKLYAEAASLIETCTGALNQAELEIREIDARLQANRPEQAAEETE